MRALVGKLIYNIFYVFYIYCKVKESGKTCFVWQEGVVELQHENAKIFAYTQFS